MFCNFVQCFFFFLQQRELSATQAGVRLCPCNEQKALVIKKSTESFGKQEEHVIVIRQFITASV